MPSVSKRQQRFMFAQAEQQKKTGHNKTGMSLDKIKEFEKVVPSAPETAPKRRKKKK